MRQRWRGYANWSLVHSALCSLWWRRSDGDLAFRYLVWSVFSVVGFRLAHRPDVPTSLGSSFASYLGIRMTWGQARRSF
jgi:hypothetical protein